MSAHADDTRGAAAPIASASEAASSTVVAADGAAVSGGDGTELHDGDAPVSEETVNPRLSREAYMEMISSQKNKALKMHIRVVKSPPPLDVMIATDEELRAKLRSLKISKRGEVPNGLTLKNRAELERLWFELSPNGPEEWARVNRQRKENAIKAELLAQAAIELEEEDKRLRLKEALEDAAERAAIDAEMSTLAFGKSAAGETGAAAAAGGSDAAP